ncbi:MAG: type II toxin-antitoxin system RelE/ParE family toxin [Castellaniella sp.]|uniref:type II toxin-antitoxin system RelE/ParE family toxin n=1 Tax=Castellaniella sp. TaxID=1955812 RepID=UPI001208EF4D|nr:type II toxin-antitoxin system RelE/ParE family toxin [Castellaniella sp.]TAN26314.1 MAG: type II toxin-antitoxin system RelE/ParE family toxin [Castellaniella sp.]
MRIEWLPAADAARDAQLTYIAQDSIQAAREVAARIERQIGQLAQFPELGRAGRRRGARELVISGTSLVVVYRVRPKLARIEILRVLHTARQWPPIEEE